jgi:molybdopterin-guanine dinucleotide biosynthesis protein A
LRRIIREAEAHPEAGCILPQSAAGFVEPLCAMYSVRIRPAVTAALAAGIRKVTDGLPGESIHYLRMSDEGFQNINTPDEWRRASEWH